MDLTHRSPHSSPTDLERGLGDSDDAGSPVSAWARFLSLDESMEGTATPEVVATTPRNLPAPQRQRRRRNTVFVGAPRPPKFSGPPSAVSPVVVSSPRNEPPRSVNQRRPNLAIPRRLIINTGSQLLKRQSLPQHLPSTYSSPASYDVRVSRRRFVPLDDVENEFLAEPVRRYPPELLSHRYEAILEWAIRGFSFKIRVRRAYLRLIERFKSGEDPSLAWRSLEPRHKSILLGPFYYSPVPVDEITEDPLPSFEFEDPLGEVDLDSPNLYYDPYEPESDFSDTETETETDVDGMSDEEDMIAIDGEEEEEGEFSDSYDQIHRSLDYDVTPPTPDSDDDDVENVFRIEDDNFDEDAEVSDLSDEGEDGDGGGFSSIAIPSLSASLPPLFARPPLSPKKDGSPSKSSWPRLLSETHAPAAPLIASREPLPLPSPAEMSPRQLLQSQMISRASMSLRTRGRVLPPPAPDSTPAMTSLPKIGQGIASMSTSMSSPTYFARRSSPRRIPALSSSMTSQGRSPRRRDSPRRNQERKDPPVAAAHAAAAVAVASTSTSTSSTEASSRRGGRGRGIANPPPVVMGRRKKKQSLFTRLFRSNRKRSRRRRL